MSEDSFGFSRGMLKNVSKTPVQPMENKADVRTRSSLLDLGENKGDFLTDIGARIAIGEINIDIEEEPFLYHLEDLMNLVESETNHGLYRLQPYHLFHFALASHIFDNITKAKHNFTLPPVLDLRLEFFTTLIEKSSDLNNLALTYINLLQNFGKYESKRNNDVKYIQLSLDDFLSYQLEKEDSYR